MIEKVVGEAILHYWIVIVFVTFHGHIQTVHFDGKLKKK